MLEDMIESKKQRRKNKKLEKLEKKQSKLRKEYKKIDMEKSVNETEKLEKKQCKLRKEYRKINTEKSVNLQSESIALANSSLVNLMKEKLASSKKSDSMPQVHSMVYKKCSFLNEYFINVEILSKVIYEFFNTL